MKNSQDKCVRKPLDSNNLRNNLNEFIYTLHVIDTIYVCIDGFKDGA